jgi:two-component sensor histidine kinase
MMGNLLNVPEANVGSHGSSILLVEDDQIVAGDVSDELRAEGFEVSNAYTGESAIESIDALPAKNLVLMDIDLGSGLDGAETAKEILRRHDIPIVFLSANAGSDFASRTREIASYGYVPKSSGTAVIAAVIRSALMLHARNRKTCADEAVHKALEEKTILLRELQHRVKNNLGFISSLLSLSLNLASDEASHHALLDARSRVHAMAAIYETLAYSDRVDRLDLAKYLGRFIDSLYKGYVVDRDNISIETRLEEHELDPKRAITLGLILNELVTNALKYAYVAGTRGEILIETLTLEDGMELRVSDRGRGLPADLDPASAESLGFTLIRLLVQQLEGKLSIESLPELGTTVRVAIRTR